METATDTNDGQTEVTETPITKNQTTDEKHYTQSEVNSMMSKQKTNITTKVTSKYEELGTIEELQALKTAAEELQQAEQIKRGEFEQTIADIAQSKDKQINGLKSTISGLRVNAPLLDEASKMKAINPKQVQTLLKGSVRLSEDGDDVEVVNDKGSIRYNDDGERFSVENLVREFLDSNPHFVQPTKATIRTTSNVSDDLDDGGIDISKLDMQNPKHRAIYAKYRKEQGISR